MIKETIDIATGIIGLGKTLFELASDDKKKYSKEDVEKLVLEYLTKYNLGQKEMIKEKIILVLSENQELSFDKDGSMQILTKQSNPKELQSKFLKKFVDDVQGAEDIKWEPSPARVEDNQSAETNNEFKSKLDFIKNNHNKIYNE